jgi:cyclophilin family peptidyl-prolyl cis-trans isomerase
MSRQRSSRGARRRRFSQQYTQVGKVDLPGPLAFMTHPKVFLVLGVIFAGAMIIGLGYGFVGQGNTPHQANEAADRPADEQQAETSGTPLAPTPVVKRYESAPPMVIDVSKRYVATIRTAKGDIKVELDPREAPLAVNSFVFLAKEGYYNSTPFMQLVANQDGSRFVAQAGDPTRTGLGTPGYSIAKETTSLPFSEGAVGMGGNSPTSNGGQFFISYRSYPELNGKYTIFGRVVSGMDVLNQLTLLDLSRPGGSAAADLIVSVQIDEL